MGFIEETGAAQHYRDARILTIYEGTTAIQANDLIGRKTVRDGGQTARAVLGRVRETLAELPRDGDLGAIGRRLADGVEAVDRAIDHLVAQGKGDPRAVYAGSVPYLMLCGTVLAGWQLARAALRASELLAQGADDAAFLRAKIGTARFYADHILTRAAGLSAAVVDGAAGTLALEEAMF
jgi:butyryl-CoA dehydrogenase